MISIDSHGDSQPQNPIRERLMTAVQKYKITYDTLQKVTGIDTDWLMEYTEKNRELYSLSHETMGRLTEIMGLLVDGMQLVNEDERIKGVIDVLMQIFGLTHETLSLYTGIEEQEIRIFMENPTSLDYEKKYKLATVSMFLHYIVKPNENVNG